MLFIRHEKRLQKTLLIIYYMNYIISFCIQNSEKVGDYNTKSKIKLRHINEIYFLFIHLRIVKNSCTSLYLFK